MFLSHIRPSVHKGIAKVCLKTRNTEMRKNITLRVIHTRANFLQKFFRSAKKSKTG